MNRPVVHLWFIPSIVPHGDRFALDDCNPAMAVSYDDTKTWQVAYVYGDRVMRNWAQWREP